VHRKVVGERPGQGRQHGDALEQVAVAIDVHLVDASLVDTEGQFHPFVLREFQQERRITRGRRALVARMSEELL